jgi:hypothetical protein
MILTSLLLLLVPLAIFGYKHFLRELKEIDPLLLDHQTSISETRKSNESPIFRSVDVPHGVSVTRGLNLRNGYKIRDGCLKDIWYLGLANQKMEDTQTEIVLGEHCYKMGQVNTIIHLVADKLKPLTKNKRIGLYGSFMESPELVLILWSCFFVSDLTIVFYNTKNDLLSSLKEDVPIIITTAKLAKDIPIGSFQEIIKFSVTESDDLLQSPFTQMIEIPANPDNDLTYEYDEHVDFANVNNHPYSVIENGHEISFFQLNFVSAIASKLMSIPAKLSWNKNDSLLISYNEGSASNNNVIFDSCCGIMSNLYKLQIINSANIANLQDLALYKPTILCIDSHILKKICSTTKKTFLQSFILQRSEYFNSLGYFNRFGRIEKSLNLKLTYVCQLTPILSSFICNFCKSVLGSRIIREYYTNFAIGPILKTNLYDFRIVQNRSLALLGVPANSVELKTINSSNENAKGKLYARGMSIGKGGEISNIEEYWVDTDLEGEFARDGCFYGKT